MLDAPPPEEHPENAPPGTRVPVLARPLSDVLSGDPHPAITLRRRDHRLEESAIRLLDLALAGELRLSVAQPDGEAVADPLELGDALQGGGIESLCRLVGRDDLLVLRDSLDLKQLLGQRAPPSTLDGTRT